VDGRTLSLAEEPRARADSRRRRRPAGADRGSAMQTTNTLVAAGSRGDDTTEEVDGVGINSRWAPARTCPSPQQRGRRRTGVHPDAPKRWRHVMNFTTPARASHACAATLTEAAVHRRRQPTVERRFSFDRAPCGSR
jgi:hypothetical protein